MPLAEGMGGEVTLFFQCCSTVRDSTDHQKFFSSYESTTLDGLWRSPCPGLHSERGKWPVTCRPFKRQLPYSGPLDTPLYSILDAANLEKSARILTWAENVSLRYWTKTIAHTGVEIYKDSACDAANIMALQRRRWSPTFREKTPVTWSMLYLK